MSSSFLPLRARQQYGVANLAAELYCDTTDETAEGIVMTPFATDLLFDEISFTVVLGDGRRLKIPLRCFPRLAAATPGQRDGFRISASGAGLHWDALDEDISVAGLLRGQMDENVR
ncbi:DUF2442 domain-containing protein [Paraburkholderia sp. DGU8]|uniref:DUF2442 domain-containing protein n=1 Tax=Paraburkholderia sp. DGU8 TaxID=3161997 RepID=UPI00346729E8